MAAGLGFKTFTTGDVLTAGDTNGYLMQGILVFATEAARNAAITVPAEGQFAFTKDTNSTWYYDGAAWVPSAAAAGAYFAGNLTTVSTATLTQAIGTGIYTAFASAPVSVTVGANVTNLLKDTPTSINITAAGTSMVVAATSADGITWTQRTLPANTGWSSVTNGASTFVAVANSSSIAATSVGAPLPIAFSINAPSTTNF